MKARTFTLCLYRYGHNAAAATAAAIAIVSPSDLTMAMTMMNCVQGLVMSQFQRYQNECKTVLELWDRTVTSEAASRPELSLAVWQ
jgi:hypothetical protein